MSDSGESDSEACVSLEHDPVDPRLQPASVDSCERAASIFRALGDVNRLRLLTVLAKQELCVSDLTGVLNDNLPAVSQRLKLLRAERLVRTRRQGKHIFYSLADSHIAELIANGLAHGEEQQ
jgi:ArsR family transcriptional regulator